MIEDIDFETGELKIDADYWHTIKPVVKSVRVLYAAIGIEEIPNIDVLEVCGLNLLFTPVGFIAFLTECYFDVIPVNIIRLPTESASVREPPCSISVGSGD